MQKSFLGLYKNEQVVLLKNFCEIGEILVHFNDIGESTLDYAKESHPYSYDYIENFLLKNKKLLNVPYTLEHFWDMYIVDALNGNFDRHGGNWGFIKKNNIYRLAPVYDNGSCMFPRLNSDEKLSIVLNSQEEINKRIYQFPTSQIQLNRKKSSYYDVISSLQFKYCNEALKRIVPKINLMSIDNIIDGIDSISEIRKEFYKVMYRQRYEKILKDSYNKLVQLKG